MEKINVAELLEDCPMGMELDCTMFNDIVFNTVEFGKTIIVSRANGTHIHLDKYGNFFNDKDAKCVIFPKGKTTWEGFQRPFKDGDIIFTHVGKYTWVSIFKQFSGNSCCTHIDLYIDDNDLFINVPRRLCNIDEIKRQRLATEEEKAKLFQAIKDNGYRWNPETKTLEKLIEPKFNVGDKVRHKNNYDVVFTITDIEEDSYIRGTKMAFCICDQDKYELVPNKFDISTLIPFESRVLVRHNQDNKWCGSFFSHIDEDFHSHCYKFVTLAGKSYPMCIPYEGNEHLLGKYGDCDEFYKTWKL